MKELKFRVWDKVKQKMFKPQAITFDTQTLAPFAVSVPGRSWEPAGKFEILQWTGLTDSNGTDVYEADFIKLSSTMYKVIWNSAAAGFSLIELGDFSQRSISDVSTGDVVGNQYENTVLLR
ncbi:MAG: YopX family protein [Desulfitobacterium hafniense]|nr:YopX family protein [Desulfitobacterium hafniense]